MVGLLADYLAFDNAYSWARSKRVLYCYDVLPPEDDATITDIEQVTSGGRWETTDNSNESTKL